MRSKIIPSLFLFGALGISLAAQVPVDIHIKILAAEDSLRYGKALEDLMKHPDAGIRRRAALAAGRIGDADAVPALVNLLENDRSTDVRTMAAFALGEIESIRAADAILRAIGETGKAKMPGEVESSGRGRLAEAAGKIAAANAKDPKAKDLGQAILFTLEAEALKGARQDKETVLLALTAALRARPENTDAAAAKFLTNPDGRIRADAANTLARIRAKNANAALRKMLTGDKDPIARANAARALGAAEDKDAVDILIKAATSDVDQRVRVSSIRSLGQLKDPKAAEPLLKHGDELMENYRKVKKPNQNPSEKGEFLEVVSSLGRILEKTGDAKAVRLLSEFRRLDGYESTEVETAFALVSPKDYFAAVPDKNNSTAAWKQFRSFAAGMSQLAKLEDKGRSLGSGNETPEGAVRTFVTILSREDMKPIGLLALPDVLRAYSEFKPDDLATVLRAALKNEDVFVRAAAAELIAELPSLPKVEERPTEPMAEPANVSALRASFEYARMNDTRYNDAMLSALDALSKMDPSIRFWGNELRSALRFPDHLVRQKAQSLIPTDRLIFDLLPESFREAARDSLLRQVKAFGGKGTKLGQVLNTEADYRRAASRRNGTVKAVLTTEKGTFTIDLLPEDAPLTVDNFIKLANAKYFDGLEVHRVVANFVMQDGDPRGDGNGGPGWSIRCEINMVPYERGVVGMALSGKDTGGSQWFVTHSPQPHLDGGYTVFGRVNESDMKVVDNIVRGDKIISVRIEEGRSPQRTQRARR